MPYHIAGIDVHKKMLAVVVADVAVDGDYQFERLKTGTSPAQLRALADWLADRDVAEVVMESTAQYWRPVRGACCRPWGMARRIRPPSRRSLISDYERHPSNSPMRSRPAPRCIPCIGGC